MPRQPCGLSGLLLSGEGLRAIPRSLLRWPRLRRLLLRAGQSVGTEGVLSPRVVQGRALESHATLGQRGLDHAYRALLDEERMELDADVATMQQCDERFLAFSSHGRISPVSTHRLSTLRGSFSVWS